MGLLLVFFAICVYQLAERDGRQRWAWSLGYVTSSLLFGQLLGVGGMADLLVFVIALALVIATKPIKRN
jgi:hypothetical protein